MSLQLSQTTSIIEIWKRNVNASDASRINRKSVSLSGRLLPWFDFGNLETDCPEDGIRDRTRIHLTVGVLQQFQWNDLQASQF